MRVSGGGLLCGRRTLRGHWRPCRDGYGMGPPNRSGLILAVGCPHGLIPFVARVSVGTAHTNVRSTHKSVPVVCLRR